MLMSMMVIRKLITYCSFLALGCNLCLIAAVDVDGTKFTTAEEKLSLRQFAQDAQKILKQSLDTSGQYIFESREKIHPVRVVSMYFYGLRTNCPSSGDIIVFLSLNNKEHGTYIMHPEPTTNEGDEIGWILFRKSIVNELHGTGSSALTSQIMMPIFGVLKMYNIVERKEEMKINFHDGYLIKVDWLLKELNKVKPDPDMMKIYLDLQLRREDQYFVFFLYNLVSHILVNSKAIDLLKKYGVSEDFIEQLIAVITNDMNNCLNQLQMAFTYLPMIIRQVSKEILNNKNVDAKFDILSLLQFVFHWVPEGNLFYSRRINAHFLQNVKQNNQQKFVHAEL